MDQIVREAIGSGRKDVQKIGSSGLYCVPFDVVDPYLRTSCAQCGCTMKTCLTCSQCGDIRYCGRGCQVESWKSIHKMYCKRHATASVGKLCWQNLFAETNTFGQISVTLREHEGLGQLMEAAIGQVLMSNHHLTLTAKLSDLKSMARIVSRRLQRRDPSTEGGNVTGLLTIAAAISTIATEQVDRVLAQTPLFRCVARHYLFHAPRLAGLEAQNEGQEIFDVPLLSATVNLVHPGVNAPEDLIARCFDATWEAIEACCVVLSSSSSSQPPPPPPTDDEAAAAAAADENGAAATAAATENNDSKTNNNNNNNKKGGNNKKKNNKKNNKKNKNKKKKELEEDLSPEEQRRKHLKDKILPNLRMLARNLAYIGAHPYTQQLYERIPKIVVADLMFGMDDFDHDAIQVWATTAQNMLETKEPGSDDHGEDEEQQYAIADDENNINNDGNNNKGDPPITMANVGNALYSIIQVCAKAKLGGADIVFRNEPPPPGCTKPEFVAPPPNQRRPNNNRRRPRK